MTSSELIPLWISLRLAGITVLILLIIGTPLAWWLARSRSKIKPVIEALVALPLVLPPTVLGFYLLIAFSSHTILGRFWHGLTESSLSFSFSGLVIGSVIYSLPFVVQPLQVAFEKIEKWPLEVAATLRASKWDSFKSIILPLSKKGFLTAIILGFTHTLGEFGVVLMIGGSIPGKTEVISISIFNYVERLEYHKAGIFSLGLLLISFIALLILSYMNRYTKVANK
jgi:molybdate transport system permease protein